MYIHVSSILYRIVKKLKKAMSRRAAQKMSLQGHSSSHGRLFFLGHVFCADSGKKARQSQQTGS